MKMTLIKGYVRIHELRGEDRSVGGSIGPPSETVKAAEYEMNETLYHITTMPIIGYRFTYLCSRLTHSFTL